jgi:hypothetical protein
VSDCCLAPSQQCYWYIMTYVIVDEMMSALHLTKTCSCIIIVSIHWKNSPWVEIFLHSNTIFLFRTNQSLFFLLSDANNYDTKGEHANNYHAKGEQANNYDNLIHFAFMIIFTITHGLFFQWIDTIIIQLHVLVKCKADIISSTITYVMIYQ